MLNLGAILTAGGSSFANVVKTTVLLADMGDFQKVNAIYGNAFVCAHIRTTLHILRTYMTYACYHRQVLPRAATCASLLRSEDITTECQGGN